MTTFRLTANISKDSNDRTNAISRLNYIWENSTILYIIILSETTNDFLFFFCLFSFGGGGGGWGVEGHYYSQLFHSVQGNQIKQVWQKLKIPSKTWLSHMQCGFEPTIASSYISDAVRFEPTMASGYISDVVKILTHNSFWLQQWHSEVWTHNGFWLHQWWSEGLYPQQLLATSVM